jgi:hypothetical protein
VRIITSDNVAAHVHDGALAMDEGWTLAPFALESPLRNPVRFAGHVAPPPRALAN